MQPLSYKAKGLLNLKSGASLAILIILFFLATAALAQGSYDLSWYVVAGGGGEMHGTGHTLAGTSGQSLVGTMQGSSYSVCSGFWCNHLDYGVTLDPATVGKSGMPGEMVTYTLRLTNTGSMSDTFDLATAGLGAYLPVTQTMLAAGAGSDVIANMAIPSSAANGAVYTAIVTATSQGDLTKWDVSTLTTMAMVSCTPVNAADLSFSPTAPLVGETITFTASFTPTNASLPITYTWDWGDGSTGSSGQPVAHIFPSLATAETYTVTLTVDNVCANPAVIAQKLVLVRPRTLYLPLVTKN